MDSIWIESWPPLGKYCRVEAPITDHLKDYALDLEKYKPVQIFLCRKIEIRRTANFLVSLFLQLKF